MFLKGALRDSEIRIEEFYRANSPPLAGAPKPVPVRLDIKVVIVGAPQWYYAFFAQDPGVPVVLQGEGRNRTDGGRDATKTCAAMPD